MGAIQNIVNELRRRGVVVHEWSGWQNRGNGTKDLDVKGIILHHTGSNYGSAYPELVSSSQAWANGGALCNFSGNSDGSLTVIAAGLTYHAGGGYGPNQGPLAPYANNRNYYTVGLEIVYPGSKPMTSQQYATAVTLSRVVVDLYAGGNAEYVRAHAEVNGRGYEGKWDPGKGVGTEHIDMNAFRNAVRNWSNDMQANEPVTWYDGTNSDYVTTIKYMQSAVQDLYQKFNEARLDSGANTYKLSGFDLLEYVDHVQLKVDTLTKKVDALSDKVDKISVGGVDYDRLAEAFLAKLDVDLVRRTGS
jgi:hypothetical protein